MKQTLSISLLPEFKLIYLLSTNLLSFSTPIFFFTLSIMSQNRSPTSPPRQTALSMLIISFTTGTLLDWWHPLSVGLHTFLLSIGNMFILFHLKILSQLYIPEYNPCSVIHLLSNSLKEQMTFIFCTFSLTIPFLLQRSLLLLLFNKIILIL